MLPCVVLKLGGALITHKDQFETIDEEGLACIVGEIQAICETGQEIILVHGAGSFGHLWARHLRLSEGRLLDWIPDPITPWGAPTSSQIEGVSHVRMALQRLAREITAALGEVGLATHHQAAHNCAKFTAEGNFVADFSWLNQMQQGKIGLIGGDIIDQDGQKKWGIISGDHLATEISIHRGQGVKLIHALNGIDGLMDKPPHDPNSELIPIWNSGLKVDALLDDSVDVTGGVMLKLGEGVRAANAGVEVWLVNGRESGRIQKIAAGATEVPATQITPNRL